MLIQRFQFTEVELPNSFIFIIIDLPSSSTRPFIKSLLFRSPLSATYMEMGVERIVDQVVNPKVMSVIEPEVEGVMYSVLGVEKPESEPPPTQEQQNNGQP